MAFPMIISEKIYSFSTLPLPTGSLRMRSYLTAPCWSFCGKVLVVPMTKSCTTGVVWKKQPAVKLWNPPFHGIHHKYLSWKHVWKRDFEFFSCSMAIWNSRLLLGKIFNLLDGPTATEECLMPLEADRRAHGQVERSPLPSPFYGLRPVGKTWKRSVYPLSGANGLKMVLVLLLLLL